MSTILVAADGKTDTLFASCHCITETLPDIYGRVMTPRFCKTYSPRYATLLAKI